MDQPTTRASKFLTALTWVISITFLFIGFLGLFIHFLAGMLMLLAGLVLFPPFIRFIKTKFNFSPARWVQWIIFAGLMIAVSATPSHNTQTASITNTVPSTPVLSSAQTSAIETAVQAAVASKLKDDVIYEGATISNAGVVSVNLGVPPAFNGLDESVVAEGTGSYTVPLLSSVFGHDYPVSSLIVTYLANTATSKNAPIIAYTMDQKTYDGTDWTDPFQADPLDLCDTLQVQYGTGADTNTQCTQTPLPSMPQSAQEKAQAAVQTKLNSEATIGDVEVDSQDAVPAGSDNVTIDLTIGEELNDSAIITETGTLSTSIFQHVFPVDSNFSNVLIRYYGQTTDQYGNTKTMMVMSYDMDRSTFGKIDWSGLSTVGNDIHMCAFLREVDATMSDSDPNKEYVGCVVSTSDVRAAESAIETGNPQYGDIPQYGQ